LLPRQCRNGTTASSASDQDADRQQHLVVERRPDLRRLRRQAGDQGRRGDEQHHGGRADSAEIARTKEDRAREKRLVARLRGDLAPAPDQGDQTDAENTTMLPTESR